jgi:hypothetical protein
MLAFLGRKANSRKRRLFACACYRHVPSLVADQLCLKAVVVSEQYSDGMATKAELCKALNDAQSHFPWNWPSSLPTARYADDARRLAARAAKDGASERLYQANLLRCLFGNPLHRVCINSNWLSSTVRVLAQEICDNRSLLNHSLDQSLFPILADALEETGCENAAILNHCRQSGEHGLGCWVLDLVLGRG